MISFKTQYDKLSEAYIHNKVEPYYDCACFIGNLLGGRGSWSIIRRFNHRGKSELVCPSSSSYIYGEQFIIEGSDNTYTCEEILQMENLFLETLETSTVGNIQVTCYNTDLVKEHPNYEDALFKAFCVTLDLLKQIHESKGEVVDEFTFTKRELTVA
jgi:hypothetical protein